MYTVFIFASMLISSSLSQESKEAFKRGSGILPHASPCYRNEAIEIKYRTNTRLGPENGYGMILNLRLKPKDLVRIKFSASAKVFLFEPYYARTKSTKDRIAFMIRVPGGIVFMIRVPADQELTQISFDILGNTTDVIPYPISITINDVEYCKDPMTGFLEIYLTDNKLNGSTIATSHRNEMPSCGGRKTLFMELITNSEPTTPGELPWHAAIYKRDNNKGSNQFICGGTVVSKLVVITAAHCTSKNGAALNPDVLSVILGQYKLFRSDFKAQEKGVQQILLHPQYNGRGSLHDISIMKLHSDIEFTNFVQPACLWKNELPSDKIGALGTVAGWGYDQNNAISEKLGKARMPIASTAQCLRIFSNGLTGFAFCAGYRNGTSPCQGDSGGRLLFPVTSSSSNVTGELWHLRGIVSLAVKGSDGQLCEPNEFVLFTDVAKYVSWIEQHIS